MSTAHDFTVFRKVAGDKIWELIERAEKAERELAAANAEMARLHRLEAACTKLILRLMTEEQSRIVWMTEEYLSPIRENLKQRFPYPWRHEIDGQLSDQISTIRTQNYL